MNSSQIISLLKQKHAEHLFVSECKDGSTCLGGHLRLDAWVMLPTWSPPTTIGYEVKVSRSDWLNDQKMDAYAPLCHRLYVVAPVGVVKPEELPVSVGLMCPTKNGTMLLTKRKAAYRDIPWPGDLMAYILMHRVKVVRRHEQRILGVEHWKGWLEEREEDRKIGHRVSTALSTKYRQEVESVRLENKRLASDVKYIEELVDAVKANCGIDLNNLAGWGCQAKAVEFERLMAGPKFADLRRDLDRLSVSLESALETLKVKE